MLFQSLLQSEITLLDGIGDAVHLSKLVITQRAETIFQTVEFVGNCLVVKTCLKFGASCRSTAS